MLSPTAVKIINLLPESVFISLAKKLADRYIKKYANLSVKGLEKIDGVKKPRIFVCNHLSNSDGLILNKVLKEKSDPYFIPGKEHCNKTKCC